MMQPCLQRNIQDSSFTPQNIWASLASEFRLFEEKIFNSLLSQTQKQNQKLQCHSAKEYPMLKEKVKKEISIFQTEIKKKLCKILYQISINERQNNEKKIKISELEAQMLKERQMQEQKMRIFEGKTNDLQKLVKIYQKALSQAKNSQTTQISSMMGQNLLDEQILKSRPCQMKETKTVLKFDRIYSIKIQGEDIKKSLSGSNLSYSRLASSRMSNSRMERPALKELENNWNKSVNLSSKSLKSAYHEQKNESQKGEKSFVKSHIKEKELNQSWINESKTPSKKWGEKRMGESWISEFSLGKN